MAADLNLWMQIANSLFTIGCGVILLSLVYRGRLERHAFYYGWSVGFFLYGIQIFLRIFSTASYVQIPMLLAFLIFFPFSMLILRPQKSIVFLFPLVLFFVILFAGLSYLGQLQFNEVFWVISSVLFFLPVAAVIAVHRKSFGNSVDKLLIGWLSLFVVNAFLPMAGWVEDALAIFGKLVLLVGIMSYDFTILTQKVRAGLGTSLSSPLAGYGEGGQFELVIPKPREAPPLRTISQWVQHRVKENIKQKTNTSILVLQDIISYSVLRSIVWAKPEMVHVFIFSRDIPVNPEFTTLRYGITEIGAAITEIAKRNSEPEHRQEIILLDLSIMIHTLGVTEVYSLLLNKMGTLRNNGTSLITPFHTQTHEESVVSLFKTLASTIAQL
jgi:hypothetical protein